jgi:hypothetical protein
MGVKEDSFLWLKSTQSAGLVCGIKIAIFLDLKEKV